MRVRKLAWEERADMLNVIVRVVKRTGKRDRTDRVAIGGASVKASKSVVSFEMESFLVGDLKYIVRRWSSQGLNGGTKA